MLKIAFKAANRGLPPTSEKERKYTSPKVVAFCRKPLAWSRMISTDFQSASIITEEATLPLRCKLFLSSKFYKIQLHLSTRIEYNKARSSQIFLRN